MKAKLLKEISEGDLFVPYGTIIDLLDLDGENGYIAAAPDSDIWFSISDKDIEIIPE